MKIWALADLHLSFGVPNKKMSVFGECWEDHHEKIQKNWNRLVSPDDLVLIPGDTSWAMTLEQALPDLQWVHERPGKKILLKGNHDYWWNSLSKVRAHLPESLSVIQNNTVLVDNISISGARLWNSPEYTFSEIIHYVPTEKPQKREEEKDAAEMFERELARLELSLKEIPPTASTRIAMTHFPPIGLDLRPTRASVLFEKYGVSCVVFGHLHSLKKQLPPLFGKARGVEYILASADWLNFSPIPIWGQAWHSGISKCAHTSVNSL